MHNKKSFIAAVLFIAVFCSQASLARDSSTLRTKLSCLLVANHKLIPSFKPYYTAAEKLINLVDTYRKEKKGDPIASDKLKRINQLLVEFEDIITQKTSDSAKRIALWRLLHRKNPDNSILCQARGKWGRLFSHLGYKSTSNDILLKDKDVDFDDLILEPTEEISREFETPGRAELIKEMRSKDSVKQLGLDIPRKSFVKIGKEHIAKNIHSDDPKKRYLLIADKLEKYVQTICSKPGMECGAAQKGRLGVFWTSEAIFPFVQQIHAWVSVRTNFTLQNKRFNTQHKESSRLEVEYFNASLGNEPILGMSSLASRGLFMLEGEQRVGELREQTTLRFNLKTGEITKEDSFSIEEFGKKIGINYCGRDVFSFDEKTNRSNSPGTGCALPKEFLEYF